LIVRRVTKRYSERNQLIVRPLWATRPPDQGQMKEDFDPLAPPSAIIEHEQSDPQVAVNLRANECEASMDAAWQALAKADPARPPLWDPRLLWLTLALAAILLIGALMIAWIDRWRKRSGTERLSAKDQLANFRSLYEKGQLSQEEFERIRTLLSRQLRHELDVPAGPPGAGPEQRPETPKPAEPSGPPA
jgi:hypothetical protein